MEIIDVYFNVTRVSPIVKQPSRNFKPQKCVKCVKFLTLCFVLFCFFVFVFFNVFFFGCMLYELLDSSVIETKQLSRFCAKSLRVPLHRTVNLECRVIKTQKGKPPFVAHVTKNT